MGDLLKTVTKLSVAGDGRNAENWNSYSVQLENALSAKEVGGIFLDDVLRGRGPGAEVQDPGPSEADWIAAAPAGGTARTAATYAAAVVARSTWARANRVAHGCVMGTLPEELQEECAQRLSVVALWRYLEDRFAAQSLTSTAALWVRLFNVRLSDYSGVSNFLTAITKLELELVRAGMQVPESLLAGAILVGIADRFPTTKELLLTLP